MTAQKTKWIQADDTSDSETKLPVLKVSKILHPIWVELKLHEKVYI